MKGGSVPVSIKQRYCGTCGAYRRVERPVSSDLVHAILSLLTLGLWIPIWFLSSFSGLMNPYRCTICAGVVRPGGKPKVAVHGESREERQGCLDTAMKAFIGLVLVIVSIWLIVVLSKDL